MKCNIIWLKLSYLGMTTYLLFQSLPQLLTGIFWLLTHCDTFGKNRSLQYSKQRQNFLIWTNTDDGSDKNQTSPFSSYRSSWCYNVFLCVCVPLSFLSQISLFFHLSLSAFSSSSLPENSDHTLWGSQSLKCCILFTGILFSLAVLCMSNDLMLCRELEEMAHSALWARDTRIRDLMSIILFINNLNRIQSQITIEYREK